MKSAQPELLAPKCKPEAALNIAELFEIERTQVPFEDFWSARSFGLASGQRHLGDEG
ncbi:MAG: hypothetical protein KDA72_15405 [Planctomycetales bacterium]|nr:hypothetical protein [Planctomycetales bacterium]